MNRKTITAKDVSRFSIVDNILYRLHKKNNKLVVVKLKPGSNNISWVRIERKAYPVHRIIWCIYNGDLDGELDIDHIDGNRQNNHISNLRLANRMENMQNISKPNKNCKSGHRGVHYCKRERKYVAAISVRSSYKSKRFETAEEASNWYKQKKMELHPFSNK